LYYIYILQQNIPKTTNKKSPKIGHDSDAPFGDRDRLDAPCPRAKWMGNGEFWPPWHQNTWHFSNLNLTSLIVSPRSTPVQIFILIRSTGASRQIGEMLRFCDFFLVGYTVFLSLKHAPRSNLWIDFHGLWLICVCDFTWTRQKRTIDAFTRVASAISATVHWFRIGARSMSFRYAKATNWTRWTPYWPAWPSTFNCSEQQSSQKRIMLHIKSSIVHIHSK